MPQMAPMFWTFLFFFFFLIFFLFTLANYFIKPYKIVSPVSHFSFSYLKPWKL